LQQLFPKLSRSGYGVVCTGGGQIAGVDPITNFVYVPVSHYPTDHKSSTTSQNGVLVFFDSSPLAQIPIEQVKATLSPIDRGQTKASVEITLDRRRMHVMSSITGVTGQAAWLVIPTTVGNELLPCDVNTSVGVANCADDLLGDPLIGSLATLSVDAVARGSVHHGSDDE
jgi:hypothetical protein